MWEEIGAGRASNSLVDKSGTVMFAREVSWVSGIAFPSVLGVYLSLRLLETRITNLTRHSCSSLRQADMGACFWKVGIRFHSHGREGGHNAWEGRLCTFCHVFDVKACFQQLISCFPLSFVWNR